jgi:hypothetical protein
MDFFATYSLTLDELRITDADAFQNKFDTVAPLVVAYAEATAAANDALHEWISQINDQTNIDKQDKRLMWKFVEVERRQTDAYAAVQVAMMGEEAWQEVSRLEQEEKDAECLRGCEDA